MTSMKRNLIPILAFWAGCFPIFAFSNGGETESKIQVPETKRKTLASLFSGFSELGAKLTGDSAFYTHNLWEYIDGGAEAFHNYDFSVLLHRIFCVDNAEVTVDVYDMGDSLNAFGIYSAERSPDYRFNNVGTQGYGDAYVFNFVQGPYYTKLSVFQEGKPDSTLLLRFAKHLSKRMGAIYAFPDIFLKFPRQNAVPNSEKYIKKSPLGHAFLGPSFEMSYVDSAQSVVLMVSVAENAVQAAENVEKLKMHFQETGKVAPVVGLGPEAFKGSNEYEGSLTFMPVGKFVVIQTGSESAGTEPMQEIVSSLKVQ
jgi:hypothetical protein